MWAAQFPDTNANNFSLTIFPCFHIGLSSEAAMVGGAQRFLRFNKSKKTGERGTAKKIFSCKFGKRSFLYLLILCHTCLLFEK
jgi:hypothetical protein